MPVHRLDHERNSASPGADELPPRTGGGGHHRAAVTQRPKARTAARRVPGHTPWAGDRQELAAPAFRAPSPSAAGQRPDQPRSMRRVGIDRQSRRSLVLGGALVVAILGGAGAIAWASKPATPRPAFSVDAGNSTGRDDPSSLATNAQSILPDPTRVADPADEVSAAGAAAPGPATD